VISQVEAVANVIPIPITQEEMRKEFKLNQRRAAYMMDLPYDGKWPTDEERKEAF
jgi:hypothetical protein